MCIWLVTCLPMNDLFCNQSISLALFPPLCGGEWEAVSRRAGWGESGRAHVADVIVVRVWYSPTVTARQSLCQVVDSSDLLVGGHIAALLTLDWALGFFWSVETCERRPWLCLHSSAWGLLRHLPRDSVPRVLRLLLAPGWDMCGRVWPHLLLSAIIQNTWLFLTTKTFFFWVGRVSHTILL